MARLPNGILGGVRGKIGGIIGASWKGIQYVKSYAIPTNPNTTGQQAQRSKMRLLVEVGKLNLEDVIHGFWNPFAVQMAGIHLFYKTNLPLIANGTDYANILMATGNLEPVPSSGPGVTLLYNSSSGALTFAWSNTVSGNGQSTDQINVCAIDTAGQINFAGINSATRSSPNTVLSAGAGRNASNIKGWVWCSRGSGSSMLVSNSVYAQAIAE